MKLESSKDLLIHQWRVAPKLSGMVDEHIKIVQEDVGDMFDVLVKMMHIDTAVGVWLDFIGVRVGIRRPMVSDKLQDKRFGFKGPAQSVNFGQAPFRGEFSSEQKFPLPDIIFRKLIKARAILNISNGNFENFERACKKIDNDAIIKDNRNMTVTIYTDNKYNFDTATSVNALPITAGVEIEYKESRRFGFDRAGETFDSAPMK